MRRTLSQALSDAAVSDAEAKAAKRTIMRRFTWCRVEHDMLDDIRWRLVARMSGSPQHLVEAFMVRLEVFASANDPRGSLDGFNIPALAAHWNLANDEQLARIYAAMEHPDVGWIDQDYLVTFWIRNPDTKDKTGAERAKRCRENKKQKKLASSCPPSRVTQRYAVTRHTRSDQIITKEGELSDEASVASLPVQHAPAPIAAQTAVHRDNGDSGDGEVTPELWLASEGVRVVVSRAVMLPAKAEYAIAGWRRELHDDMAALAEIIHAIDLEGACGGRLMDRMRHEVSKRRNEVNGPQLPFKMVVRREG